MLAVHQEHKQTERTSAVTLHPRFPGEWPPLSPLNKHNLTLLVANTDFYQHHQNFYQHTSIQSLFYQNVSARRRMWTAESLGMPGTRGNQDFSKWKPLELFTEQHLGRDIEGQVGIAFLLLLTASFPSYIPPQSIHLVWSLSCLVFLPKENTSESLRQVYLACFEYSSKREKEVVSFIKKKKYLYFSAHSSI